MIKGIGTDIIDISRVKRIIEKNPRFVEKVYTDREIRYCESKNKREIHYAARFAAKEAFFKAIGTGYRGGMSWQDISVVNDELGKPSIELSGQTLANFQEWQFKRVHLSISHTKKTAVSFVVVE